MLDRIGVPRINARIGGLSPTLLIQQMYFKSPSGLESVQDDDYRRIYDNFGYFN